MKLYDTPMAPNPRRVRIFIAEKGITIPTVDINLMKGEHRQPEYRNLVPNGRVPALELDDGKVLCESIAICRYLESLYPEPNLMGKDALEIAEIEMWTRRMEFELMMPVASAFRHVHPAGAKLETQFKDFGLSMKKVGERSFAYLNKVLAERPYIAGDRYTIADISAICTVQFGAAVSDIHVKEDQPHLKRWADEMAARPAVQSSLASVA
ncbi:MAG: glutathione S-transferase family protein [Alphaproteobacteria bacterium]|nr:MAG: glutathione S-transferase family protein [Alphaproteobacteria bacterium]